MIYRCTDHADPEAGGEPGSGHGAVPQAWDRNDDLLQLAQQAWWHGRVADVADEIAGDRERARQADVCGSEYVIRFAEGCLKKAARPCDRKEMAKQVVSEKQASITWLAQRSGFRRPAIAMSAV